MAHCRYSFCIGTHKKLEGRIAQKFEGGIAQKLEGGIAKNLKDELQK